MKSEYVGQAQPFKFQGSMMVFEVIGDADGILKLRSTDLMHVTRVSRSMWDKQKKILEEIEREQES